MEDNSCSDDEIKESPVSPKSGGKKLKLNDGSSQGSQLATDASTSKAENDENVDSGISADKSESTSSDDRPAPSGEGPSNHVVNVAPSSSNAREILLSLKRTRRIYRKRKSPGRDSDSSDSSQDSDDMYPGQSTNDMTRENSSDIESEDMHRLSATISIDSVSGTSDPESHASDSDDLVQMASEESTDEAESDDEGPFWSLRDCEREEGKCDMPAVLMKTRPKHNYFMLREIIHRELGLTFPAAKAPQTGLAFEHKFYGSLHAVYRMEKLHQLNHHKGCVNSINFHPQGKLLVSGSDDTNVVIWDWARKKVLQAIKTGHKSNVFQSKFLHLNAESQINIVTCARDGQVRLIQWPASGGGGAARRRLCSHVRAAHKLHVSAHEPHLVVSAAEDGLVLQCDVRTDHVTRLFHVKEHGASIPLYSVHGHPLDPRELLVAGRDKFVRLYDRRKSPKPLATYCPLAFTDPAKVDTPKKRVRMSMMHLTCAVYNHDGTEILGSYNDEDIYLFDKKADVYDKDNTGDLKEGYTHHYSGHRNCATFKVVTFFGPNSEYIISGSDCSYIYIWEKKSEAIVQWMQGDVNGVVNCLESHPRFPILASSGLDKDVKLWAPRAEADPDFAGMERVVRGNMHQSRSPLFNDFLPSIVSAWRGDRELSASRSHLPNIEFDANVCTAF
ncbi:hypothetical protein ACJJTC_003241 [Scirpophaga incertulas]